MPSVVDRIHRALI